MKIWFIEIGEPLPMEQGKRLLRYGYFTAFLANSGHDVTWWACDFSHAVKAHVAQPGDVTLNSGVHMKVLPGRGYTKNISLDRVRHQKQFAKDLGRAMENAGERPDLIMCPIPTIENAGVIAAFARKHKIPYLLDIRDNWPEEFTNWFPKIVRPFARIALHPAYRTAKAVARNAASITGVTRKQRDYGATLAGRKADDNRDPVFYLGYTRHPVSAPARVDAAQWWKSQGLKENAKIASFTGTIGQSFDFAPVIAAARRLKNDGRSDIQFVLAGDGGTRKKWMDAAGDLAGDIILFPGWIDQPKIDTLLSGSMVAIAPYVPNTAMSLPNKFFEYMAYGLPVLSSCTGESEDLIRRYNFGAQYNPKDFDQFFEALSRITGDAATAGAMGQAALTLYEKQFDQSMLFTQMERHMTSMIRHKDPA